MNKYHPLLAAGILASALHILIGTPQAAGPQGAVYQFTVPKQGNMVDDATYYCWLPKDVAALRSIIVHQHGCTREGDAQQMMTDLQWLSLAKKWHSVFIAPKLITGLPGSGSSTCDNWNKIENGSGNTFLAALDTLARRTAHPEIKIIPWALWGHSGGSMWITAMAGKYPARVAVGVAEACGTEISDVPAALKIPILHHNGKADMCYNDAYFSNGRSKGALWAHAVNPFPLWVNTPSNPGWSDEVFGHAPHDLRMIAIPWIESGLEARLPDQAGGALKDMDTSHAWLGDKATHAIASAASFAGNKLAACWFPNQAFALKWAEYMAKGTLNDSTQAPAPYNLSGIYSNRQITLKWDADADLETGIKTFVIYRNGAVYNTQQFNGAGTYFTLAKGFQRWQDGDQPAPAQAPAMTFTDAGVSDTGTYAYQISTVNWSDVAGMKSGVLTLKGGQVTVGIAAASPAIRSASRQAAEFHCNYGACGVRLFPDKVGIYDIKGALFPIKTIR